MHYELWDVATGNCVGRYDSEVEVMARVRRLLADVGSNYADDLEMTEEDELGNFHGTTSGAELIARATATASAL
jgi:hypothetical protein